MAGNDRFYMYYIQFKTALKCMFIVFTWVVVEKNYLCFDSVASSVMVTVTMQWYFANHCNHQSSDDNLHYEQDNSYH